MYNKKYFFQNISLLILLLIINSVQSQRLSQELLGGWNEKEITDKDLDYMQTLLSTQTYISEQGHSLDEIDIILLLKFSFFNTPL